MRTLPADPAIWRRWYCIAAVLVFSTALWWTSVRAADPPPLGAVSVGGASSRPAPAADQRPSFIESLSSHDATLEVTLGQGRLLTLTDDLSVAGRPSPLIATGDPTVIDFEVVGPRHIRITGLRIGATDLSIVTGERKTFTMEVNVVPGLDLLRAKLRATFPDATIELAALRQHVIVEGEARDARQVGQIVEMIEAYLKSIQPAKTTGGSSAVSPPAADIAPAAPLPRSETDEATDDAILTPREFLPMRYEVLQEGSRGVRAAEGALSQVINLLRVPGPQQVLLKVQVAELNRTALRRLGVSFLFQNGSNAVGSTIGPPYPVLDPAGGTGLLGLLNPAAGATSTLFGVLDNGNVNWFVDALRRNQVLSVLAEPNLVALHGQEANFLAGGEFPVPVPQPGNAGLVTIEYRSFGVQLTFVPYIIDGDTIRLSVAPEVSSIDFAAGVVIQGTAVPGLATRRTSTVVELREGQTLAISGILQLELDGTTNRVPGLGDLPLLGTFFRNNSTETVEKELVVLVTPYLVEPLSPEQVPPLPIDGVREPDDCEFYLRGRQESRDFRPYRSTGAWDDPLGLERRTELEHRHVNGPYGYSP